jgi:LuxR family maltose regulon positive regulatory protein
MGKDIPPIVENDQLHFRGTEIEVGSADWFDWLQDNHKFNYHDNEGHFLARCEKRRNDNLYWYAYRRQEGKLNKEYLGKFENLSKDRLRKASEALSNVPLGNPSRKEIALDTRSRIDNFFFPKSKVNAPELPQHLLPRPHLTQQINTPLTLIYAPSGFGKSTLLNEWKQTCCFPVVWLVLDRNDDQPIRFWQSLVMALQTVDPQLGQTVLNYLKISSSPIQRDEVISLLAEDLASFPTLALVLEDFHHIHNSQTLDFLQSWLDHFPQNLRLVISGHVRPPLSLGDLRARSMVTELDTNDLRFSLEEGVSYLSMYPHDPPLALDDLEKLAGHTEGWAAGLTLTALALGKQTDRRQFVDTFSGAHIYFREYFMETILNRLSQEIQSFLLKTSIVKHFTASLCDALTGQTNGEEILSYLWKENIFVVRLAERGFYRYHDLFAEMLYDRLQAQHPEEIALLHQKAAQWYNDHHAPADAISHLIAAKAWEEAAALIEEAALRELDFFGEDSRLLRWLQELPENVVQQHKTLLFVYLQLANVGLPKKKIQSFIASIETNIARKPVVRRTQDEKELLEIIHQIRETWAMGHTYRPPLPSGRRSEVSWQLLNNLHLVKVPHDKIVDKLEERIFQYYELGKSVKNLFVISMAGGVYARRVAINGQLNRSEKVAHEVIQQSLALRGALPEPASIPLSALSLVHFERYELEKANMYLSRAMEVDPNPTSTNLTVVIAILRSKIQLAQGKGDDALATIQSVRELHSRRPSRSWSDTDLIAYEALVCARTDDIPQAKRLLDQTPGIGEHPVADLVRAEVLFAQEQLDESEEILRNLISKYPISFHEEPTINARVMLAAVLFAQHKFNQSRNVMKEAIRLAERNIWLRPFMDFSKQIAPILQVVLQTAKLSQSTQTFVNRILERYDNSPGGGDLVSEEEMEKLCPAASITAREQDVLKLLGVGQSNQEIAINLCISESTVKTHLGNIYLKLEVNNRVQATTRAKELELI